MSLGYSDISVTVEAEGDAPSLRKALLDFSVALICHDLGGQRYQSAMLSYSAM